MDSFDPTQQAEIAKREVARIGDEAKTIKVIKSDEDLIRATDLLGQVKAMSKQIQTVKDGIIKPLNLSIKNVRELFKAPEEELAKEELAIKTAIVAYHTKIEEAARKKAAKIEAQVEEGNITMQAGLAKMNKVKQADNSIQGTQASAQIRTVKKVRIINPVDLPVEYLSRERVLEALRMEVADDLRRGNPLPSGAELYEEKVVAGTR